jgi:hypothetical protein
LSTAISEKDFSEVFVLPECGAASLGGRCPTFRKAMVVSIRGSNYSSDVSTLKDETTTVFPNVGHKSVPQFRRKKTLASF